MLKKSSLALIVPCYNEEESIRLFINELAGFVYQFGQTFADDRFSVLIVNNQSTDNSLALLTELTKEMACVSIVDCETQGYGAALKRGFGLADAEYISFLDLDNTYPINMLSDLYRKVRSEELDIVYGARIHEASKISFIRSLGNRFYVLLLKYMLGAKLSDVCSGMRVFRAELKKEILSLESNDLSFSIDFTSFAVLNNWKISELPIEYRTRTGESKLSVVTDGFLFLFVVIKNFFNKKIKNV